MLLNLTIALYLDGFIDVLLLILISAYRIRLKRQFSLVVPFHFSKYHLGDFSYALRHSSLDDEFLYSRHLFVWPYLDLLRRD